jgi:hypothetical protein
LKIIDSNLNGRLACFASLLTNCIDNAMFVVEIMKITHFVLVFQKLKLEMASLLKL